MDTLGDLSIDSAARRVDARDANRWAARIDEENAKSRHVLRVPRMPLSAPEVAAQVAGAKKKSGKYGELNALGKMTYTMGVMMTKDARDAKRSEAQREVIRHMRDAVAELEAVVAQCEASLEMASQVLQETKDTVMGNPSVSLAMKKRLLRTAKQSVDSIAARRDDALVELQRFKLEVIQRDAARQLNETRLTMAAKTAKTLRKMPKEDVAKHSGNMADVSDGLETEDADRNQLAEEFADMRFGEEFPPLAGGGKEENDYEDDAETLDLFRQCGLPTPSAPPATASPAPAAYSAQDMVDSLPPVPSHTPSAAYLDMNRLLTRD